MNIPLIQLRSLSKSYGGVRALQGVSLEIEPGEVHAICGENGAGKSTLIKALTGVVVPDQGTILVNGVSLPLGQVSASMAAGIAVMHQESTAFPDLDVVANVFVGREIRRCCGLFLDHAKMRRDARDLLGRLGESIGTEMFVGKLPIAQRQMVAMARALSCDCRLLIMDEPTASLSTRETEALLQIVAQLRDEGVSILYVSHRLEELFHIADRVTVLRDGMLVDTRVISEIDKDGLIKLMVGREVANLTTRHEPHSSVGDRVLSVNSLTRAGVFADISFDVRAGEIVGLAGLVGAGRTEIARALFGIDYYDSGSVTVAGHQLSPGSVQAAMTAGLALVPEDRQLEGLVLPMSVGANISLTMLNSLKRWGLLSGDRETQLVARQMRELSVKAAEPQAAAAALSGGNQQKLVLAKWLAGNPRVLILDEPTRGVDVGAKAQVHRLIRGLATEGLATIVISSELPEIFALSDRILVVRDGRIVGELDGGTATQEETLALALPAQQEVT